MAACPNCGAENREGARFCDSCGSSLTAATPLREMRKTVTVLFCDVTGSTALGERLDPESLRRVLTRYFDAAKAVVERHGGTVEKFIGDAVMAVFGIPVVHEDDALRAVRAADELRTALLGLNDELAQAYGTRLELRTGVNTGEVVTGTAERLATGDAVNVAARLEQAAQPGEVLIGEDTLRLVRDAVDAEPTRPLDLKGKAQPVQAFRLVAVRAGAPAFARSHVPMVGRDRPRRLLDESFGHVRSEGACHLFTVLGTAGVGKSRLAAEFLNAVQDAAVCRGRCLSYGDGISYFPVVEAVKELLGDEADARLGELGVDGTSAAALSSLLGEQAAPADEIAWAVRKLFEAVAAERPLIVLFEDIHWGEPAFLDLVEHVADFSRDAPILLLCTARSELLDRRGSWGGGKRNATSVHLEPLGADETEALIDSLLAGVPIGGSLRERILAAAGGNPLFVEEMVAMLRDRGSSADGRADGEIAVPPTIQALLASRLDQLEPFERDVLERGAVEGQVFHRGAVVALAPEREAAEVAQRLLTLVRKDLVRPERTTLPADEAFRFRHLLIRDAAYEALPKATRAALHERFAAWLEEHAESLVELDEIVGYHLEQAYRYRAELGPLDEPAEALAPRAAARLIAAGRRAQERGDASAARLLLGRGVELLPVGSDARWEAGLDLAVALSDAGEQDRGASLLDEVVAGARANGDEGLATRAALARIELSTETDPTVLMADALVECEAAAATLGRLGDDAGVVSALRLAGQFEAWLGRANAAEQIWFRALEHAERAGKPLMAADILGWLAWSTWWGALPADEGERRLERIIARGDRSRKLEAIAVTLRGCMKAMRGAFSEARADVTAGRAMFDELGQRINWAGTGMLAADVELLAQRPDRAEELLLAAQEAFRGAAQTGYVGTIVGFLSQTALEQGRLDDALALADETEQMAAADDFEPRVRVNAVRARVFARHGDLPTARRLASEAVARCDGTDYLPLRAFAYLARAEIERIAGDADAERPALMTALALSERKGDLVTAGRARERLDALAAVGGSG